MGDDHVAAAFAQVRKSCVLYRFDVAVFVARGRKYTPRVVYAALVVTHHVTYGRPATHGVVQRLGQLVAANNLHHSRVEGNERVFVDVVVQNDVFRGGRANQVTALLHRQVDLVVIVVP